MEDFIEYEVTLHVTVPANDPDPSHWDWAELTDMLSDDIYYWSTRIVQRFERETEESEF